MVQLESGELVPVEVDVPADTPLDGVVDTPPPLRYSWSCSRTGIHHWRLEQTDHFGVYDAGGKKVSEYDVERPVREGSFRVEACTDWHSRRVTRHRAASAAARQVADKRTVFGSRCASIEAGKRNRAAKWRCRVEWGDGLRTCWDVYRVAFERRQVFGMSRTRTRIAWPERLACDWY